MRDVLRGGRLTKLAGEVASCAPLLGRLAVSILGPVTALGIAVGAPTAAASTAVQVSGNARAAAPSQSVRAEVVHSSDAGGPVSTGGGRPAETSPVEVGTAAGSAAAGAAVKGGAAAASGTAVGAAERASGVGAGSAVEGGASGTVAAAASATGSPTASGTNPIEGGIAVSGVSGYGDPEIVGASGLGVPSDSVAFNEAAGCTTTTSNGTYITCSGTITAGTTITGNAASGSLTMVIQSGASIVAGNGSAIMVRWAGPGLRIEQRSGGKSIIGAVKGIYAVNSGSGSATIITTGTVRGTSSHGIHLTNGTRPYLGGVNVVTEAAISAQGPVFGGSDGIFLENYSQSGSATVSVASVDGGDSGIEVKSTGSGGVSILARGPVIGRGTGTADAGIFVSGMQNDISIAASSVTGASFGIHVRNQQGDLIGTADPQSTSVTITASGDVGGNG